MEAGFARSNMSCKLADKLLCSLSDGLEFADYVALCIIQYAAFHR